MMTDDEFMQKFKELWDHVQRAGVKLEPDGPRRDRFDEAAENMVEIRQEGKHNFWIYVQGDSVGEAHGPDSAKRDANRLIDYIAAALRAEAAKGEGAERKLARVKLAIGKYGVCISDIRAILNESEGGK